MALSLARSGPHPAAPALSAPRISHFATLLHSPRRPYPGLRLRLPSAAVAVAASSAPEAQAAEPTEAAAAEGETRRKVFVGNMPWSFSAAEIQKLFSECGIVKDVEVIMKDGRKRGFAFVTMSTTEEAAAAVEKFNEHDLMGRTIKVEFSKSFRKPAPPPSPDAIVAKYKLYVSNLAWKARSPDMKQFFSQYNPVSANVVFDDKKSAGYGFVSFGTEEEAETALSELNGKELMGRAVLLRWREDKEAVKADGEVEGVKVNDQPEGVLIDNSGEDEAEVKQE